MRRGAVVFAIVLGFCSTASAELGRDDQWRYVPATEDHGARAELRGDRPEGVPTQLIIQVECVRSDRVLLFRYDASPFALPEEALSRRMGIILNEYEGPAYSMPTTHRGSQMLGRLALNNEIATAIRDATYVWIDAPNDMDEPWHGGSAPALRQLTDECWESPVG